MPTFYRVHLGKGGSFAQECLLNNYIGVDFAKDIDFRDILFIDFVTIIYVCMT
jgi:hypothetical protein